MVSNKIILTAKYTSLPSVRQSYWNSNMTAKIINFETWYGICHYNFMIILLVRHFPIDNLT
jgi:hypothetical protein